VFGIALIGAGIFLFLRARAMWSTVDRQFNSDTWYDFTDRMKMFGFGVGMIVIGCLSIYAGFVSWFTP